MQRQNFKYRNPETPQKYVGTFDNLLQHSLLTHPEVGSYPNFTC